MVLKTQPLPAKASRFDLSYLEVMYMCYFQQFPIMFISYPYAAFFPFSRLEAMGLT